MLSPNYSSSLTVRLIKYFALFYLEFGRFCQKGEYAPRGSNKLPTGDDLLYSCHTTVRYGLWFVIAVTDLKGNYLPLKEQCGDRYPPQGILYSLSGG
jgi:hypothetical protein